MPAFKLSLDNTSKIFLAVAIFFTVVASAELIYFLNQLPPLVPLYYSLPWGEGRLVAPIWLATLPVASLLAIIINSVGSALLNQVVLTRILSSTALLVSLLSLITLTKIIFLGLP